MALRGRRIKKFLELWYLVGTCCLPIWVSSTSFQKSNIACIGWPQQPLTESIRYQWKIGFLMIHSAKKDQYWSFWWQGWSNYKYQEVLWWNRAVEVGEAREAREVAEADEANEVAEVVRPRKSLLRTSESSRLLNSASFWCFEKKWW